MDDTESITIATTSELFIEGVLSDHPVISRIGPTGRPYATCRIRATRPVGHDDTSQNSVWPVIIHRAPAVELMKSAMPGDVVQIRGAVQGAHILVPRSEGRVDVLLFQ